MIRHSGNLRPLDKCRKHSPSARVLYISLVFSNDHRVLPRCNTRLRLLYLLSIRFRIQTLAWGAWVEVGGGGSGWGEEVGRGSGGRRKWGRGEVRGGGVLFCLPCRRSFLLWFIGRSLRTATGNNIRVKFTTAIVICEQAHLWDTRASGEEQSYPAGRSQVKRHQESVTFSSGGFAARFYARSYVAGACAPMRACATTWSCSQATTNVFPTEDWNPVIAHLCHCVSIGIQKGVEKSNGDREFCQRCDYRENNVRATISAFWLVKSMSINP